MGGFQIDIITTKKNNLNPQNIVVMQREGEDALCDLFSALFCARLTGRPLRLATVIFCAFPFVWLGEGSSHKLTSRCIVGTKQNTHTSTQRIFWLGMPRALFGSRRFRGIFRAAGGRKERRRLPRFAGGRARALFFCERRNT